MKKQPFRKVGCSNLVELKKKIEKRAMGIDERF